MLLQVARVLSVDGSSIPSEKLYKLQLDVGGNETRQVVAGLKMFVTAEQLRDSLVVAILNLKPAKLAGVMSEAMVLAAEVLQGPAPSVRLLRPPGGLPPPCFNDAHSGLSLLRHHCFLVDLPPHRCAEASLCLPLLPSACCKHLILDSPQALAEGLQSTLGSLEQPLPASSQLAISDNASCYLIASRCCRGLPAWRQAVPQQELSTVIPQNLEVRPLARVCA